VTELALPADQSPPPMGLVSRIFGVIFSPRATYTAVAARPAVVGVLAVTLLISAGMTLWLLSSGAGQRALGAQIEESMRQAAERGQEITPQTREFAATIVKVLGIFAAVAQVVIAPAILALMAVILRGILNFAYGTKASFRQLFAIVAHSSVISALVTMFSVPLMYYKEDMVSPTRVATLLPMLPEKGFITSFLGAIDLWLIWWLCNLAIGLAVVYKRRTGPLAGTLLGVYGTLALLIAAVRSAFN
jgi:hypothetical protein